LLHAAAPKDAEVVSDTEPVFETPGPLVLAANASGMAGEVFDGVLDSEQPENNSYGALP
jgi:hypothetical protein